MSNNLLSIRVYELDCTIPLESELKVQIFDYDYLSGDDLIGETKIDLENRFLSTHRGICGLPKRYYTYVKEIHTTFLESHALFYHFE